MARRKKENRWEDIDGGSAFVVPYTLLRHPNFTRLSAFGHKLLMDLARQYTGFNNGYLCASWALMQEANWNSENTVRAAMLELEHYGLIQRTQQGGKNRPNLHAFTWRRIDEKKGQPLDVSSTAKPTDLWKEERPEYNRTAGERKAKKVVIPARKAA
ncbi:hypothetical protein [Xanthomonas graminis]|uniref:Uncharacterized protein n=1 Tax=Xanthomonas graminis pv. phlei TaxID=487906 RepID=A0A0K2ZEL0_9XANT|nr:hypothetical protein [Xanthomonas translucens]UKE66261.1 hypothetical protein KM547_02705 [Xanthomonas translucens pv. phlei]CTP83357.1 hypothetical protein XTPLMG730_0427 [Xanthomonas translucens pv. phlei]